MTRKTKVILLVEANALLGFELELELKAHGHGVAGPFCRSDSAIDWLERGEPDAAIVGADQVDATCLLLACELKRRGIPLLACSGSRRQLLRFQGAAALTLDRPISLERVMRWVEDCNTTSRLEN